MQELELCSGELGLQRERSDMLGAECSGLSERLERLHTQFSQLKDVYDEVTIPSVNSNTNMFLLFYL